MFALTQAVVGSLFLWLALLAGFGVVLAATIAGLMVLTNRKPRDIQRALAVRAQQRERAKALAKGEELPPEPDPSLVLVPAIIKAPGAAPVTYGTRYCQYCDARLSPYWPDPACLDCIAVGRVRRDAITGAITNR